MNESGSQMFAFDLSIFRMAKGATSDIPMPYVSVSCYAGYTQPHICRCRLDNSTLIAFLITIYSGCNCQC